MMLSLYDWSEPIRFPENQIQVLVIEHHRHFRRILELFLHGLHGEEVELHLTDTKLHLLPFHKNVELIFNPFKMGFQNKKLIGRLQEELTASAQDLEEETALLLSQLNAFAGRLALDSVYPLSFSGMQSVSQLIKSLDFSVDSKDLSVPEQILEYMKLCRELLGKRLFVFVNLKCFLDAEELERFYQSVFYEKYSLLLLESAQGKYISGETVRIIDDDLCEIS